MINMFEEEDMEYQTKGSIPRRMAMFTQDYSTGPNNVHNFKTGGR